MNGARVWRVMTSTFGTCQYWRCRIKLVHWEKMIVEVKISISHQLIWKHSIDDDDYVACSGRYACMLGLLCELSVIWWRTFCYRPRSEASEGYVFTGICLSNSGGGMWHQMHHGIGHMVTGGVVVRGQPSPLPPDRDHPPPPPRTGTTPPPPPDRDNPPLPEQGPRPPP